MRAPYTILADVPDEFLVIVGDADGRIYSVEEQYIKGLPSKLLKDAVRVDSGIKSVRVPMLPVKTELEPWDNLYPFAPMFEHERIPIEIVDIDGKYGLLCGFGKNTCVWVICGKLERWVQN